MNRPGSPTVMRWSRRRRVITALLALLHLLFMQLAVAGYRCPMAASPMSRAEAGQSPTATAAIPTQSPCTEPMPARAMDPDQPNLCQAHCLADAQASGTDHGAAHAAPPAPTFTAYAPAASLGVRPPPAPHRNASGPPLAVLHCCWRI